MSVYLFLKCNHPLSSVDKLININKLTMYSYYDFIIFIFVVYMYVHRLFMIS